MPVWAIALQRRQHALVARKAAHQAKTCKATNLGIRAIGGGVAAQTLPKFRCVDLQIEPMRLQVKQVRFTQYTFKQIKTSAAGTTYSA